MTSDIEYKYACEEEKLVVSSRFRVGVQRWYHDSFILTCHKHRNHCSTFNDHTI